jgi:hypothetical protein
MNTVRTSLLIMVSTASLSMFWFIFSIRYFQFTNPQETLFLNVVLYGAIALIGAAWSFQPIRGLAFGVSVAAFAIPPFLGKLIVGRAFVSWDPALFFIFMFLWFVLELTTHLNLDWRLDAKIEAAMR